MYSRKFLIWMSFELFSIFNNAIWIRYKRTNCTLKEKKVLKVLFSTILLPYRVSQGLLFIVMMPFTSGLNISFGRVNNLSQWDVTVNNPCVVQYRAVPLENDAFLRVNHYSRSTHIYLPMIIITTKEQTKIMVSLFKDFWWPPLSSCILSTTEMWSRELCAASECDVEAVSEVLRGDTWW